METSKSIPLRALPRVFVPGANPPDAIELPKDEVDKLRKVLRLSAGAQIAVLPNDGSIVRCVFRNHFAEPIEVVHPNSEATVALTVAQALPKGDKLDEIVRACTEIGVARFVLFSSDRTVVRWDDKKTQDRLRRLETIARESSEMSFRTKLPTFELAANLDEVLEKLPNAAVLSESEKETKALPSDSTAVVVGPEGGWTPREFEAIGSRGVTLGPRVLRVEHAAPAAAAMLLLERA
jgi:16S rRNA (uracil1498-N3)-methyltransferase